MTTPESAASIVEPPFGPPDCPWIKVSSNSSLPQNAVYKGGKVDGENAYIGRVYDGRCVLIGTVIPKKGVCVYFKNNQVKSSSDYEVLTVDCGDPLEFQDTDLGNRNIFIGGIDEDEDILYIGLYTDSKGNTYYGWIDQKTKSLHIPSDSDKVIKKEFKILIHIYLDRLCICPPGPIRD